VRSLNYLLKNCEKLTQQTDMWAVAHLAHHVLLRTSMQSMIWHSVRRVHQGHTKPAVRSPGKLAFCRGQWDASYTQRHSAKVPEEMILAWLGIQQSITDQAINQWRNRLNACVKTKGKHFEHLCDVFVRKCQFVMTFNACITVVMNRLTYVVFHKVVQ